MLHEAKFWVAVLLCVDLVAGGVALVWPSSRKIGGVMLAAGLVGLAAIFFFWPETETASPAQSGVSIHQRDALNSPNIVGNSNTVTINPASASRKCSSRQILQASNIPGDYNETLNLDNIATLHLWGPIRESVILLWPTSPPVTVTEPKADQAYNVPGGGGIAAHVGHVPGVTVRDLKLAGQAKEITFDVAHSVHLIRVGERIFRVSLESINDKANAERLMFFEYTFAVSEEEPTAENRAAAISQDAQTRQRN